MADYPIVSFHYEVDWGGTKTGFSEVSGLNVEADVVEYRDGTDILYTKLKIPGLKKYGNVTLKRGVLPADNEFFDWWNSTQMDKPDRRDLTITLLDETHSPVMVWQVRNAWPIKVDSPGMKADSSEIAIESIELANEGVIIQNS